jgi:tetratricopeptide (TPR) repeat protein
VLRTAAATTGLKPDSAASPDAPSNAGAARPAPAALGRPFRREESIRAETLQPFREIVAAAARTSFDAGVSALKAGDFVKAEQSFKSAQRATPANDNSTAPLTYLAATYAASGHDLEASSVWQTALIDGHEYPQIYEWLAEAFLRIRNVEQARSILQEAAGKWPADSRFSTRLAALPPTEGVGR